MFLKLENIWKNIAFVIFALKLLDFCESYILG